MENLQDILNRVGNSDISKNLQLPNLKKRKIVYVFKDGILIDRVYSITSLKEKYHTSVIALKGGYENKHGLFFSYENEYKPKRSSHRLSHPPILVYHQNDFMGEFNTDREIEKEFNLNRRDIIACLTNRKGQKSTKGYTFEYKK